jgi:hypothetical protein
MPLGQITLQVTFGNLDNLRTEFIKFEVATSNHHTMLSLVDLLWPSSWLPLTTRTSCSRCRVQREYSIFEATSNAHMTMTRKPSRLQQRRNRSMKHSRLPTLHSRLSRKTWRFQLRRRASSHDPLRRILSRSIWVLVIPVRRLSSVPTSLRNRNSCSPTFSEK